MGLDGREIKNANNKSKKAAWTLTEKVLCSTFGIFLVFVVLSFLILQSDKGASEVSKQLQQDESQKKTAVESKCLSSGRIVFTELSSVRDIGPITYGPGTSIAVFIEENLWNSIGKEKQNDLTCYMPELVKTVSSDPSKYLDMPSTAPVYKRFYSNAKNMASNSWEIMTGRINANGNVNFERTVLKGY